MRQALGSLERKHIYVSISKNTASYLKIHRMKHISDDDNSLVAHSGRASSSLGSPIQLPNATKQEQEAVNFVSDLSERKTKNEQLNIILY